MSPARPARKIRRRVRHFRATIRTCRLRKQSRLLGIVRFLARPPGRRHCLVGPPFRVKFRWLVRIAILKRTANRLGRESCQRLGRMGSRLCPATARPLRTDRASLGGVSCQTLERSVCRRMMENHLCPPIARNPRADRTRQRPRVIRPYRTARDFRIHWARLGQAWSRSDLFQHPDRRRMLVMIRRLIFLPGNSPGSPVRVIYRSLRWTKRCRTKRPGFVLVIVPRRLRIRMTVRLFPRRWDLNRSVERRWPKDSTRRAWSRNSGSAAHRSADCLAMHQAKAGVRRTSVHRLKIAGCRLTAAPLQPKAAAHRPRTIYPNSPTAAGRTWRRLVPRSIAEKRRKRTGPPAPSAVALRRQRIDLNSPPAAGRTWRRLVPRSIAEKRRKRTARRRQRIDLNSPPAAGRTWRRLVPRSTAEKRRKRTARPVPREVAIRRRRIGLNLPTVVDQRRVVPRSIVVRRRKRTALPAPREVVLHRRWIGRNWAIAGLCLAIADRRMLVGLWLMIAAAPTPQAASGHWRTVALRRTIVPHWRNSARLAAEWTAPNSIATNHRPRAAAVQRRMREDSDALGWRLPGALEQLACLWAIAAVVADARRRPGELDVLLELPEPEEQSARAQ